MRVNRSHGRFLSVLAILCIPTLCGLVAGFWIALQMNDSAQEEGIELNRKKITALAQVFHEGLQSEIELIRQEANQLALLPKGSSSSFTLSKGRILYWAELGLRENTITGVIRSGRNPSWNGTAMTEQAFIRSLSQNFNTKELQAKGSSILRIKQDPDGYAEWLSFAFPSPTSSTSMQAVLVDPIHAFPEFLKWNAHGDGGRVRSYLIGKDGRVLVHSQSQMNGKDFSTLSTFQNQIKGVFNGNWRGGSGETKSFDQLPVLMAYFRLKHLPLAVVVEEVMDVSQSGTRWSFVFQVGLAFSMLLGLLVVCTWVLRRFLTITQTQKVEVPVSVELKKQPEKFFTEEDLLMLDISLANSKATGKDSTL